MKNIIATMAAMLLVLTACTSKSNQDNQNVNENMEKKEKPQAVEGRKNFGSSHALVITPQPCVMIATWDKDHNPDVMMAAWAGQLDYTKIVISLSKHKTTDNLAETGAFTVSFADERTVAESDYFGLVSAGKVPDKVARAGFTVTPSPNVDAPIINEYPLTLECRVVSFEDGMLIGEVVNQSADESILTDGKVDLTRLKPIVFDAAAMCYRALGDSVGKAWGSGKSLIKWEQSKVHFDSAEREEARPKVKKFQWAIWREDFKLTSTNDIPAVLDLLWFS